MKKNLYLKLFILTVMALFTITACQNEDENVVVDKNNNEAVLKAVINELSGLKVDLDNITTDRINAANDEFADLKQMLEANPNDENIQAEVIAKAVHIEVLTSLQTRAVGTYPTTPTVPGTLPTGGPGGGNQGVNRTEYNRIINYLNNLNGYLAELKTYIEANTGGGGGGTDLTALTARVEALEGQIAGLATKAEVNAHVTTFNATIVTLQNTINALESNLNGKINILNTLLGIAGEPPASSVLSGISTELSRLESVKANKFTIEEAIYDLKDVYDELIGITDALDVRLTQAEADIVDLQERVKYIEDVEIPAIWDGISVLYEFIVNVYENFDQRVTGITFKPEYDYGPGLSSLILVKGVSEWESKDVENGFGWQVKEAGSVYKGFTWLTYNISPANADLDLASVELVYTTTKLITRSGGEDEPLLKIAGDGDRYQMTYENGVLRVPVLIHSDAYPLIQTSFDVNASENIKVALQVKNSGIDFPEEPKRPEKEGEEEEVVGVAFRNGGEEEVDRSVVSSEYVTVWLGLFEGRIAEKDSELDNPTLYPTEIVTADFRDKTNEDFPSVTLLVTSDDVTNEVDIAESVVALYFDEYMKEYTNLLNEDFEKDYTLTYELVDLGNNAGDFLTLTGSTVTVTNKQKSIGETVAILVKAEVDGAAHAVGYVRVLIVGQDKEVITIGDKLSLADFIINCSTPSEFTIKESVQSFVSAKILGTAAVSEKTKITDAAIFYQKYKGLVINEVSVANSNATLAELSASELKSLFSFAYVPSEQYIKGTVSNDAPIGTYTVVTTLSSDERIPDIKITWKFTVKTPKLIWDSSAEGLIVEPTVPDLKNIYSTVTTQATFGESISDLFKKHQNGGFEYVDLNGQVCPEFVVPYFVFANVPNGYTIAADGKSVLKNGVTVAVIEDVEGDFRISLIENDEVAGLVGSNQIKIAGKGIINGGTHTIYDPFSVVFKNPLILVFPTDAKLNSNNIYILSFYKNKNNTPNVVRDYLGNELTIYNDLPGKIFINHYGVNLHYDTSFSINTNLPTQETINSPFMFDVENATFSQSVSGVSVTIEAFQTADTRSFYGERTPIRYRFKVVNNSGNPLPSGLEVTIPAVLKHRWGISTENLTIKVN